LNEPGSGWREYPEKSYWTSAAARSGGWQAVQEPFAGLEGAKEFWKGVFPAVVAVLKTSESVGVGGRRIWDGRWSRRITLPRSLSDFLP